MIIGVPSCGCLRCDICKVFDRGCGTPNWNCTLPGIAPRSPCMLTSSQPDQQHKLKVNLSTLLHLHEQYFSCLRDARPAELMLYTPDFYGGSTDLKARLEKSPDVVMEFRQYIIENCLWIHDVDLNTMKLVAKAVKIPEGELIVEKMESLLVELIKERTVYLREVVQYPSYCRLRRMPQYVFILDDEFSKLQFSESLFYALYHRVRASINSDGCKYIAFVTLQTATEKGLKVIRHPTQ